MVITAANIIKGVLRRRRKRHQLFPSITWLQEKVLKHQEDQSEKKWSAGKLHFYYKRPYELLHTYREIFENEIYRFETLYPEPVIVDCGSNIGLSVLYYKSVYPQARVFAFEPDAGNFQLLKKNTEANQFRDVVLHEAAIWTADGSISFSANESEASHIQAEGGRSVKAVRLASFLDQFDHVDFLKIDIEGAEAAVIEDSFEQLRKVRQMFLEYHGKANETGKLTEMLERVRKSGFEVYIRNAADALRLPFIEKTTGEAYDVQLNLFCYR